MHRRHAILLSLLTAMAARRASSQTGPVARVTALASGGLLLNGRKSSLPEIKATLKKLQRDNGAVWYFRENPQSEPTPEALEVIKLIVEHRLPVSMSSEPDFSDYIDESGHSRPRK